MAKPTGISGFFCAHVTADGQIVGSFEKTPFSEDKAAVENQIVDRFIASMNKPLATSGERFCLADPQRNDENNLDFTVTTPSGPAYLELMEIAPLRGPHEGAPAQYKPYEFGKAILLGILKKSNHYPKNIGRDIFLLLYVTHWAFALSQTAIACLRYWLKTHPTVFRAIFAYEPLDAEEGAPHWLFPVPPELIGAFNPEQVRDNVCLNLNPQKWQVVRERKP